MWVDIQQNSDSWFSLRLGKVTSSNFDKIMANEGKAFGNPAIQYAQKIATEIVTDLRDERGFKGAYFEDGHTIEPIAIEAYEADNFCEVTNGGFNDCGRYGDSPDGNVKPYGCVEVKGVIQNTQWERLKKGGYQTAYKWQIQGHIWLGEKEWCDFISFCPEMPQSKQLYTFRVDRDNDMIDRMKSRLKEFVKEVDKNVKILNS
tara:strand:- start:11983 stop:12591 length:609 start_codon:yes stop_codon:yes gene_type:complete